MHEALTPTLDEQEWAIRMISAAGNGSGSAFAIDGMLVEKPLVKRAQQILIRAGKPPR